MWWIGQALTKRLWNRLELESLDRTPITLSDKVVLTEDIQRVLQRPTGHSEYASITHTGSASFTAVPPGELWHLDGFSLEKSGGTFTFSYVFLSRQDTTGTIKNLALDRTSSKTIYDTGIIGHAMYQMPPGSKIAVYVDSHSVNGNLQLSIHYRKETLF